MTENNIPSSLVISRGSESWAHQPDADKDGDCFVSICFKQKRRVEELVKKVSDHVKIQGIRRNVSGKNIIMTV